MKLNFNFPPKNKKEDKKEETASNTGLKKAILGAALVTMGLAANAKEKGDPTDSLRANDIKKMEALINKSSEKVEIKIANYFETDKAEISAENGGEISKLVSTYINNLNSKNVDKFINSTPELNVSCDPRNTNSYENGNLGLARARPSPRS
jgi:hypothetical protein